MPELGTARDEPTSHELVTFVILLQEVDPLRLGLPLSGPRALQRVGRMTSGEEARLTKKREHQRLKLMSFAVRTVPSPHKCSKPQNEPCASKWAHKKKTSVRARQMWSVRKQIQCTRAVRLDITNLGEALICHVNTLTVTVGTCP